MIFVIVIFAYLVIGSAVERQRYANRALNNPQVRMAQLEEHMSSITHTPSCNIRLWGRNAGYRCDCNSARVYNSVKREFRGLEEGFNSIRYHRVPVWPFLAYDVWMKSGKPRNSLLTLETSYKLLEGP